MAHPEVVKEKRKVATFSKEERKLYIEKWQSSKLSKTAFCREEGLRVGTFCGWISEKPSSFIPLKIKPAKDISHKNLLKITTASGLSIEGIFELSDVGIWLKEINDAVKSI